MGKVHAFMNRPFAPSGWGDERLVGRYTLPGRRIMLTSQRPHLVIDEELFVIRWVTVHSGLPMFVCTVHTNRESPRRGRG